MCLCRFPGSFLGFSLLVCWSFLLKLLAELACQLWCVCCVFFGVFCRQGLRAARDRGRFAAARPGRVSSLSLPGRSGRDVQHSVEQQY